MQLQHDVVGLAGERVGCCGLLTLGALGPPEDLRAMVRGLCLVRRGATL